MGKKPVKQLYHPQVLTICWPIGSCDRFGILGQPIEFQQVSHLGFITAATSLKGKQPNFAGCLPIF